MSDSSRIGIVGLGYIASHHATALRSLKHTELVAVCDSNQQAIASFRDSNNIDERNVFSSIHDMVSSDLGLDSIHVLTPPPTHYEIAHFFLERSLHVYVEKPLALGSSEARKLQELAYTRNVRLSVSHNFLFWPVYERLRNDLRNGKFGQIVECEIDWSKELGQLASRKPQWLLESPQHVLREIAPHSFVQLIDLLGDDFHGLRCEVGDPITLPSSTKYYRTIIVTGMAGRTAFRLKFAFRKAFPYHRLSIRGTSAQAEIDFEQNTYSTTYHQSSQHDLDRLTNSFRRHSRGLMDATKTFGSIALSNVRMSKFGNPFTNSIFRAIRANYDIASKMDSRLLPELAVKEALLAEAVATSSPALVARSGTQDTVRTPQRKPNVLVVGGAGFIGIVLVSKLSELGFSVRVGVRGGALPFQYGTTTNVEQYALDTSDPESIRHAIAGIDYVFYLARGHGRSWNEYVQTDLEPTRLVAEVCSVSSVKKFIYASSIAPYFSGDPNVTIDESTEFNASICRVDPYARSKQENEKQLQVLKEERGLALVTVRPGVVIGKGSSPFHWGVASWPYDSLCIPWGDGRSYPPFVLVDDVAKGLCSCLDDRVSIGESFNLVGERSLSSTEYIQVLQSSGLCSINVIRKSPHRQFVEALTKYLLKLAAGRVYNPVPTIEDFTGRTFRARFSNSKAKRVLGWEPVQDKQTLTTRGILDPLRDYFA